MYLCYFFFFCFNYTYYNQCLQLQTRVVSILTLTTNSKLPDYTSSPCIYNPIGDAKTGDLNIIYNSSLTYALVK